MVAPISFGSAGVLRSPPRVFGPTAALGFAAFGFAPGGCVHSRWWRFSPRFLTADWAVFSSRERTRASAAVVALSRSLAPLASASASAARASASTSAASRCVACSLSLALPFCLLPFLVDRPYPLICDRGQASQLRNARWAMYDVTAARAWVPGVRPAPGRTLGVPARRRSAPPDAKFGKVKLLSPFQDTHSRNNPRTRRGHVRDHSASVTVDARRKAKAVEPTIIVLPRPFMHL